MADQNIKDEAQQQANADVNPNVTAAQNVQDVNREFQEKSVKKQAHDRGLSYIDIAKTPLNPDFLKLISFDDARRALLIPFFRVGKKLRVAVKDTDASDTVEVLEKLKNQGFEIDISLASEDGIKEALKFYDSTQKYKKKEIVESVEEKTIQTYEKEIVGLKDIPKKIDSMTAEEGLNLIDVGAMKTKSSDIHYEPEEGLINVRFRIDGVLHKVFKLKPELYRKISEQIKYQSKMKLNVSTVPQDGRYVFTFNENKIAVRVSSIPTPYGESFVCRYLPSNKKALGFEELGFQGLALKKLEKAAAISQGMILVTGPTGSGKSTTLYSLLGEMNSPENKIITLEDPVEYFMSGVTQSQIDEGRGYSFAGGLRTILRQDPDIIMLGEIRDLETAETAAQAALTGHVLLSTLHTNSAIESIPRLINMGLPPFMVAPALNTIIGQRLVRRVCPHCSTQEQISDSEREEFEKVISNLKQVHPNMEVSVPDTVPKVKGCDQCSNTGYLGRVVIAEVITISSEIKNLILNNASTIDIIAAARKEGITTIREDGLLKVAQGITTLSEVHRVTNVLV